MSFLRKFCIGLTQAVLAFAGAALFSGEQDAGGDGFPPLDALKPPLLLPKDAAVTIDADGDYCFDGRPRFLIGAQIDEQVKRGVAPTEGYPKSLSWLYEEMLDYERAQRIGFDSVGYFIPDSWIPKNYGKNIGCGVDEGALTECLRTLALPVYVDFTCAGWSQGKLLKPELRKDKIPSEAFNVGGDMGECNHWVPYSATHPEGRKLYAMMWESGARHLKEAGGKALFYELFNEPAYNDPSDFNRGLFVKRMTEKYGTIEALNADWRTSYADFEQLGRFKSRADNPALFVEWGKFMEDAFVDVCKLGVDTIRAIDPQARFCVQTMGGDMYRVLPRSNVNLFKLSKICETTSTGTGGGLNGTTGLAAPPAHAIEAPPMPGVADGILQRRFMLSISKGKPIHDGEMYAGGTKDGLERQLWLQMARGGNAAYFFKWTRRSWDGDWKPAGSPEGGKKVAEKFPYLMLNPFGMPTDALTGIMEFKRELYKIDDLFVPRERNIPREVAVILSFPTVRYAGATGSIGHHDILAYSAALEFSHYPCDVLLEEQLPEGRQSAYKILVAPGVRNIYPETVAHVRTFVERGGVLVLGREALGEDEHGNKVDWKGMLDIQLGKEVAGEVSALELKIPQAADLPGNIKCRVEREFSAGPEWSQIGFVGTTAAVFVKKFGAGKIYFIGVKMPDYSLASVLGGIMQAEGVKKPCALVDAATGELEPNVEMWLARRDEEGSGLLSTFGLAEKPQRTGIFLFNWDVYPKLVKVKLDGVGQAGVAVVDPLAGEQLEISNGEATALLPPQKRVVLVCGPAQALALRYGACAPVTVDQLRQRAAQMKPIPPPAKPDEETFTYSADSTKTRVVNLRAYANRHFEDKVPGDGKGGWTDQGVENSLRGVPWGVQTFCGVPFEIIRFDENAEKTCIVLASPNSQGVPDRVAGIPIGDQVKALYFLQASAWTSGKEAFRYVVNYTDGTKDVIPIRGGVEVADWWLGKKPKGMAAHEAWRNSEGRGFYAFRWECPNPKKTVATLDIESANNPDIPIVIAVTVETP